MPIVAYTIVITIILLYFRLNGAVWKRLRFSAKIIIKIV
jgi:hypothetical protein